MKAAVPHGLRQVHGAKAAPAGSGQPMKLVAVLLAVLPQVAFAHGGPTVGMFAGFMPLLAYLGLALAWLRHQTRLPLWLAFTAAAMLFLALGCVAFFLPGLLPISNQHHDLASLLLNGALTLVLVGTAVKVRARARRKR
ncbi:hypothetical protein LRH25_32025 [Ideonella azotifigens]|uniref:Uncharacterized protein n=1 Tax=Ideonella azotifigens TaxID=513160 RepID=A0ABN1K0C3_9BURK|nr:hypothetical protein [Ideonella azotifigens]MCD2344954.1 hypothetical protein [Ideonella azotifigens]